jgi:hypothetical protein
MASGRVITSVADYLSTVQDPGYQLGLASAPVTPWYLGQPDLSGTLVPAFYKSGIEPILEREVLRDYRQSSAEYWGSKGALDDDLMVHAHQNGLPARLIDWYANPLVALFLAVESLSTASNARIWVLNPWILNELVASLSYVPMSDTSYFKKYIVRLDDPDASPLPEATQPMAFRPYRTIRNYNTQNIYWTIHGRSAGAIEDLTFFMKRADAFLTFILVDAASKKAIMRELHDIGVTRANLFPAIPSLARTLVYRYSPAYMKP